MKFGILVNEGPYTHQASDSAYHFTKAALEKGHEIYRVFFYNDGVNNGTRLTVPPQDERNIQNNWTELAEKKAALLLPLRMVRPIRPSSAISNSRRSVS